jgi:chemotaxis-related protein WspB
MMYILFSIGDDRCALDSSHVVEVVPRVDLWQVPRAPAYVAGVFRYRGQLVPVLDLCQLMQGQPCPVRLSTRILLVHYPDNDGTTHILGLMVERVTDTLNSHDVTFAPSGISADNAPYLGDIATDEHGMIHRLRVESLLPAPMRVALLSQPGEPKAWPRQLL